MNMLASYFGGDFRDEEDKEKFLDAVVHGTAVDNFVMGSDIPVLLKERWKQFLRSME